MWTRQVENRMILSTIIKGQFGDKRLLSEQGIFGKT